MTIWLLALLLLAALVLVGYSQGAIRVAISLVGILMATLLAVPLGGLIKPALRAVGVANPLLIWALAPFVVFCLINIGFKLAAMAVHRKVDLHYRYKAGELRLALWERTNKRLGACLGLVNGVAYLLLIGFVIHAFSYWTAQLATGDNDSMSLRLLNRLGRDLQVTRLAPAAAAVGKLPASFYNAADLAGLLFKHPLLEARLSRYPGLLSLGERPELQTLGADRSFADLRLQQSPLREVLANSSVDAIIRNPELVALIWNGVVTDGTDLENYLRTLKTEKYASEEILGRWSFDLAASMLAYRRERPALPANEVPKIRRWMDERFNKVILIAAPDQLAVCKNLPLPATPTNPMPGVQNLSGKWGKDGSEYELIFPGDEVRKASIHQGKLSFKSEGVTLVFSPES